MFLFVFWDTLVETACCFDDGTRLFEFVRIADFFFFTRAFRSTSSLDLDQCAATYLLSGTVATYPSTRAVVL